MTAANAEVLQRKKTTLTAFVIEKHGVTADAILYLVDQLIECKARHGELNLQPCRDCGDDRTTDND